MAHNTKVTIMGGYKVKADKNSEREIIKLTSHRMYMLYVTRSSEDELPDHGEQLTCFYRYN